MAAIEEGKKRHPLTDEMVLAVDRASARGNLKIVAYAGAGKTSLLVEIAHALGSKVRTHYAAFNKANAVEASTRFPGHVKSSTFHSLAFRATPRDLVSKLNNELLPNWRVAELYGLRTLQVTTATGEKSTLSSSSLGAIVADSVARFCRSGAKSVGLSHVAIPNGVSQSDADGVANALLPAVKQHWQAMTSTSSTVRLTHDAYLKLWAMREPTIPADCILFDEAQDAGGVMLDVLRKQSAQVIYVGDEFQQLYDFRGAVNAMAQVSAETVYLTQSFRFGPEVAAGANELLQLLGPKKPLRGTAGIASRLLWSTSTTPEPVDALLVRTNATGIGEALYCFSQGQKVCLQINGQEILHFCDAAEALLAGRTPASLQFSLFSNWAEFVEYSETAAGADYAKLVKLTEDYGVDSLRAIINTSVPPQAADVVITTGHKSKGLEWARVRLGGDFRLGSDDESGKYTLNEAEARLDYVAITRARKLMDAASLRPLIDHAREKLQ